MDNLEPLLIGGTTIVAPGQMAYMKLPADVIRNYVDSKFPELAKCSDADFIKGYGHRWKGGHDLFSDVPRTLLDDGPLRALKHVGHLLTDLPTKAGIPIPGLSGNSLGQWLIDMGIPKGYLSIHWADGCLGVLSISEGSTDIIQALSGALTMNTATFFDTFAEGGVEIALAAAAKNAWGLAAFNPAIAGYLGGIENILAGIISAYKTLSVYVDPLVFFGSAGTSALIGFGISYGLAEGSLSNASIDSVRSGTVGAFFSFSPAFGFGALAGFVAFKLGKELAKNHNSLVKVLLKIDENSYSKLLDEMCIGNICLTEFLDRAETRITLVDITSTLSTQLDMLDDQTQMLPENLNFLDSNVKELPENKK